LPCATDVQRPAAAHVALATLENDLQGTIDYHLELSNSYIVCPRLPEERRRGEAGYRALADVLNRIGAACRAHGLQLCYHNHDFELQTFGGRTALDLLYESTDHLVQAEIDVYWARKGSGDPMAAIRRLAGRCPLLHLKDMADDAERSLAEVGTGITCPSMPS
jgi:sugar phosphate isomerase/epimerase